MQRVEWRLQGLPTKEIYSRGWKLSYERQEWKGPRLSSWVLTGSTSRCVFKYLYVTSRKTTINEFSGSQNKNKQAMRRFAVLTWSYLKISCSFQVSAIVIGSNRANVCWGGVLFLENVIMCENRQSPCMLLLLWSQSQVPSNLSPEHRCIYYTPYMPLMRFCVRIFSRGIVLIQLGGRRLSQRGSSLDSPSAFKYLRTCHNDLDGVFPLHELCPAYPSS